ncbi:hypothetical protein [Rhizobacter sp. Root16D2]|uniref:hypothetical protein n=1 Tax=Rhizobacter sp. Root16D2 TaxID=1736479 RepID=UPI0006FE237C|nr:hypothetical protein [Rhizobacter sp. Root16D2]KRB09960.1 hypothetical protein ASE08_10395 [Rhizobacter sp. Root16D2]
MSDPAGTEHDIERDRHLRQALRHAPDADAAAPAALRDLILREAQAKAREGRRVAAAAPSWPRRLWQWIGSPRFAGALAGVVVIGFAGLLWRERPPEEALPPRAAVQAPAAPAAEPASPASEKKKGAEASIAGAAAPAPAPAPAPSVRTEKPKQPPAAPRQAQDAPRRDTATDPRIVAEESTLQMPRPTAPAPTPTPTPTPAPAPAPVAAPPPPAAAAGTLSERSRNESRERSDGTADRPARVAPAKAAAPASLAVVPDAAAPAGLQAGFAGGPAIAQLRQQITSDATHWYWQRPGGPQHPFDNAVSQWLGRLDAASRGRWQSLGNVRPAPGTELQLLRDGEVTQRLQVTDDALVWERRDVGETWRAPLDAATLAALRQALEQATP